MFDSVLSDYHVTFHVIADPGGYFIAQLPRNTWSKRTGKKQKQISCADWIAYYRKVP